MRRLLSWLAASLRRADGLPNGGCASWGLAIIVTDDPETWAWGWSDDEGGRYLVLGRFRVWVERW